MKQQRIFIPVVFSLFLFSCIWESPLLPESDEYAGYTVVDNLDDMVLESPAPGSVLSESPESIIISKNLNCTQYRFAGSSDSRFSGLLWDVNSESNILQSKSCCFYPGVHYIRIQVFNGEVWSDWKTLGSFSIELSSKELSKLPVAGLTLIQKDLSIECDASSSYEAALFRWDFDNDGTYETGWTENKTIFHTYQAEGKYNVALLVRSGEGFTDKTERPVTVKTGPEIDQSTIPVAPDNITAVEAEGGIEISWNDNSLNETGFILQYSEDNNHFKTLSADIDKNTVRFFHSVQSGKTCAYRVAAVNNAGQSTWSGSASAKYQVPVLSGLSDLSGTVRSIVWEWGCDDSSAVFRYLIDNNNFEPSDWSGVGWVPGKSASLESGTGTFYLHIQARDSAGNISDTLTVSAALDNTAPVISDLENIEIVSRELSWDWSSDGTLDEFQHQISETENYNENNWSDWSTISEVSISSGDGRRYLHVRSRDSLRNHSEVVSVSGILDNTPPDTVIISAVSETNDLTPEWSWTASAGSSVYRYGFTDGEWIDTPGPGLSYVPSSNLSDGDHTLYVQAGDAAGNWSASVSFTITVDSTITAAPSVSGATITNNNRPQWSWGAVAGANAYRYGYSEGSWLVSETTDLSYIPVSSLSDGEYTLYVQARNSLNHWSLSGLKLITIDTVAPDAPVISGESITNTDIVWNWTLPDDVISQEFRIDEGSWNELSSGQVSYTLSAPESTYHEYTFELRFYDAAMNASTENSVTILDNIAPVIDAGPDIGPRDQSITLSGAACSDEGAVASIQWTNLSSGTGTVEFNDATIINPMVNGIAGEEYPYILQLTVTDTAGNITTDTMTFKWDDKAPVPGAGGNLSFASVANTTIRINWISAAVDGMSVNDPAYMVVGSEDNDISTVANALNTSGGTRFLVKDWASGFSQFDASGLTEGKQYYFNVLVKDDVGNISLYTAGSHQITGSLSLDYSIDEPWDKTVTFNQNDGLIVYRGDLLSVSINETFNNYEWELPGIDVSSETGSSVNLDISGLPLGVHYLTAFVNVNGHVLSKSLKFYVYEEFDIGDRGPAGGFIFYDDEDDGSDDIPGVRYLEISPENVGGFSATYVWGGDSTSVITSTGIGTGKTNTANIINVFGDAEPKNGDPNYVAKMADYYSLNGYSDWFLPSSDELGLLYSNLSDKKCWNLTSNANYWSSSDDGPAGLALEVSSGNTTFHISKSGHCPVRAARAF